MARHSTQPELDASQLVITTSGLSETEIAAVTAVLTAAVHEQTAHDDPQTDAGQSAWQRGQRNLRTPLRHGPGSWRSFG